MQFAIWMQQFQGTMSVTAYAKLLGIPHGTLVGLLSHGATPKIPTMEKIAKALHVPFEEVMAAARGNGRCLVKPPPVPQSKPEPKTVDILNL